MLLVENPSGRWAWFESVREYEESEFWEASKIRYRLSGAPMLCWFCASEEIDLHHLHYNELGREQPAQLLPLCATHHHLVERVVSYGVPRRRAHILLADRLGHREQHERTPTSSVARLGEGVMSAQSLAALEKANRVRLGRAAVKAKLRSREITLGEALSAPCCATATIFSMLTVQYRWGERRANKFLAKLANSYSVPINGVRRVEDLTERQLATLLVALGERVS